MDSTYIFYAFLFRYWVSPMTLLTAGALTALIDPHLPATASNVCTTDGVQSGWRRPGAPQTKIVAKCLHCAVLDGDQPIDKIKVMTDIWWNKEPVKLEV